MVPTTYDADPALSLLGPSPSRADNPARKQAVSFTHFPTIVIPVTGMLEGRISKTQLLVGGEEANLSPGRGEKKAAEWLHSDGHIHHSKLDSPFYKTSSTSANTDFIALQRRQGNHPGTSFFACHFPLKNLLSQQ